MHVRELRQADWPAVLDLNRASERELSPLDRPRLRYLLSLAHRSLVAESSGNVVAFVLAMAPATAYDSANYRWFADRLSRFLYLDRIAVAAPLRRCGIGRALYDVIEIAARDFDRVVCDVNLTPPNDASLAFHDARGYREVGRLRHPQKLVALLSKELRGAEPEQPAISPAGDPHTAA